MKKLFRTSLVFLGLLLVHLSATAQPYSINWFTVDGGGGTSSGGIYSLSGTIGQPDANHNAMVGGTYSLTGGFWALYAVQVSGAPVLSIVSSGAGLATISWTPNTPGWILQETLSLAPPVIWGNSPSGSLNPVVVPSTLPGKFYRLFHP